MQQKLWVVWNRNMLEQALFYSAHIWFWGEWTEREFSTRCFLPGNRLQKQMAATWSLDVAAVFIFNIKEGHEPGFT